MMISVKASDSSCVLLSKGRCACSIFAVVYRGVRLVDVFVTVSVAGTACADATAVAFMFKIRTFNASPVPQFPVTSVQPVRRNGGNLHVLRRFVSLLDLAMLLLCACDHTRRIKDPVRIVGSYRSTWEV